MALPSNDHHVHSDGYYSDKGEADPSRMLEELADELDQIDGVHAAWPEGDYIEVEYDGQHVVYGEIEDEVAEWDCHVSHVADDWCEIEPSN